MSSGPRAGNRRNELGRMFLARLGRLVALGQQWGVNVDAPLPELLRDALASTYLDCVCLGLRAEAYCLLAAADRENGRP